MKVIPAIDLLGGKCVRLVKGKLQNMLSYSDNPLELAERYAQNGAERIHVIDLDGAFSGKMQNLNVIAQLAKRFSVQVGGGVRNEGMVKKLLNLGVNQVIVSTLLMEEPEIAKKLKRKYYGQLIGSFDFDQGKLCYAGWTKQATRSFEEIADGLDAVVVTDTRCDGTLDGPNLALLRSVKQRVDSKVIAAGGVSDIVDLLELKRIGIDGAIIGRALLEKRISLRDVFKVQFFGD